MRRGGGKEARGGYQYGDWREPQELMARLGHPSVRAAMMYQHATRDRDRAIAQALGALVREVRPEPAEGPGDQGERRERDA